MRDHARARYLLRGKSSKRSTQARRKRGKAEWVTDDVTDRYSRGTFDQ